MPALSDDGAGHKRALGATPSVSRREGNVLELIAGHLSNSEIAARLFISERTVESHVSALLRKYAVGNRRALVRVALAPRGDGTAERPPLPAMLELLAHRSTFVGRDGELAALQDCWTRVGDGHTLLVVVSGEAGIGKSRLVSEFAVDAHIGGGRVLFGACFEDVTDPYGPFAQAIAGELADRPESAAALASGDRQALGRLSPQLARALGAERAPATLDGNWLEQELVVDAVEQWLVGQGAPTLIVVEDLHWATGTTRDLLRTLTRRAGHCRLMILITSRDSPPDDSPALTALLGDLARSPVVIPIHLEGLDRDGVVELLRVDSATAAMVLGETGGNPLLVTHRSGAVLGSPVAGLLGRREALLDEEARDVLDLAAAFGAEFDATLLAAGRRAPLVDVLRSLEQAEAAGLVVPLRGLPNRFRFVHALFRTHRYEGLHARRRLELHAKAASALVGCADDERDIAELARHAFLAVPIVDAREAVRLTRQAGDVAAEAYAYEEAAIQFSRGLEIARQLAPSDPHLVLDLRVRVAAARYRAGDPEGVQLLLDAAEQARVAGARDALVRAATSLSHLGAMAVFGRAHRGQVECVEHALAVLDANDHSTRARLLAELAVQLGGSRSRESVELAEQAEAIARELNDPEVLGAVLLGVRHVGRHPSRLESHLVRAVELERLGDRLHSRALTLSGINAQALLLAERGDLAGSFERWDRVAELRGDRHLPFFELMTVLDQAWRALLSGQLDRAESLAASSLPMSVALGHPPTAWSGQIISAVRRLQSRDDELIGGLRRIIERADETSVFRCVLAASAARVGETEEARRLLASVESGRVVPAGYGWSQAMSELAEAAEVAGDAFTATVVVEECGPYSGLIMTGGPAVIRPFDQALAQSALGAGDPQAAASYAERAVAASRGRDTPLFLARELVLLAEGRRRLGSSRSEVAALVAEARVIATRFGAKIVLDDIERFHL